MIKISKLNRELLEKAKRLQELLEIGSSFRRINSIGFTSYQTEYNKLRIDLLRETYLTAQLPEIIKKYTYLEDSLSFINTKYRTYYERKRYIREQFSAILEMPESDVPFRGKIPLASNRSNKEANKNLPAIDFGIVTALPIERDAILSVLVNTQVVRNESMDIRTYYLGEIKADSLVYRIVVLLTSNTGPEDAVAATSDLIRYWDPRYIAMIGTAAGYKEDDLSLGDVVVADQVIEYEYAKESPEKTEFRPRIFNANALLLDRVKHNSNWSCPLDLQKPDGSVHNPKLLIGPIASGSKISKSDQFKEKIKSINHKILAIEMEGGGVANAVWQIPVPKGVMIIRGISDWGDASKNDLWKKYAATSAAKFFADLLRSEPISETTNSEYLV